MLRHNSPNGGNLNAENAERGINMQKNYLSKEARAILEKAMSKTMRKEYKDGKEVYVEIYRPGKHALSGYGKYTSFVIRKNGEINNCDLSGYQWSDKHIAENVIGYFLHGKKGYDYYLNISNKPEKMLAERYKIL